MITVHTSVTKKETVASLYSRERFGYILHISRGRTEKQALQAMVKELKRLTKEAEQRIKDA